jgi:membrane protein implicated in regulation of membrane protease activity
MDLDAVFILLIAFVVGYFFGVWWGVGTFVVLMVLLAMITRSLNGPRS